MKPDEVCSAFPHPEVARLQDGRCVVSHADIGMSLRDWFAGKALAGLVAQFEPHAFDWRFDDAAQESYRFADAMLKAREAKP